MDDKIGFGASIKNFFGYHWKGLFTFLLPIILLPVFFSKNTKETQCLYVVCVMAVYWITEVIPLHITSLLPIVVFPLLGILDSYTVCVQYLQDTLVLFLCSLIISLAIEYSNLHQRIALRVILLVGCSPRRLHFGLVMVTSFISWWITNSAATAMMCPIIKAVLDQLQQSNVINIYEEKKPGDPDQENHPSMLANAYYLGVAYASSIGGCGTLIGTGTNLTFKGIYEKRFPETTDTLDFPIFMAYCLPFAILAVIALYVFMQFFMMGLWRPNSKTGKEIAAGIEASTVVKGIIQTKYAELGSITCHEWQVILCFLLMVVLLFTRKPGFFTGWADIFNAVQIKGSWPMVLVVVFLLILPQTYPSIKFLCGKNLNAPKAEIPPVLDFDFVKKNTSWGLLLLLGGGFALAKGSTESGMARMLGESLSFFKNFPLPLVQFCCLVSAVFFTNFSSNVAIANILIPVFCEMAVVIKVHPLYLVYPAGLGCSLAYHLPVSTPPNAIVSGYANIRTKHMAIAGFIPTITGVIILFFLCQTWHFIFYPDVSKPDWATEKN